MRRILSLLLFTFFTTIAVVPEEVREFKEKFAEKHDALQCAANLYFEWRKTINPLIVSSAQTFLKNNNPKVALGATMTLNAVSFVAERRYHNSRASLPKAIAAAGVEGAATYVSGKVEEKLTQRAQRIFPSINLSMWDLAKHFEIKTLLVNGAIGAARSTTEWVGDYAAARIA